MRYLLLCLHELYLYTERVIIKKRQFNICYIRGQPTFKALLIFEIHEYFCSVTYSQQKNESLVEVL